ncbi:MAG: hypothetical protein OWS74_01170, partial [Firmicutes bacterium]|nr:hypothetical protein [Bacillota bacterium]
NGMNPVYTHYPQAAPSGNVLSLSGQFQWGAISANTLVVQLTNHQRIQSGILFSHGVPVYRFRDNALQKGQVVPPATVSAQPVQGTWINGGPTGLTSFSAAGSHVYLTNGNHWTIVSGSTSTWLAPPQQSATLPQVDFIAALPSDPSCAMLMEEYPSGKSLSFVTTNQGTTWTPWPLGQVTASQLTATAHRFYAIINGTLQSSGNGMSWQPVIALNTSQWLVNTYAVNPANPQQIVISLGPVAGSGMGPVLQTNDGGKKWHQLPGFPKLGPAPSSLVYMATGNIAALVNLTQPVIVTWHISSHNWQITNVPDPANTLGSGEIAATSAGRLIYSSPSGMIYQENSQAHNWQEILPPAAVTSPDDVASPLVAIGNHQILAAYSKGWYIFVQSAAPR